MFFFFINDLISIRSFLIGANFASSGIGILNDTGIQCMHSIWLFHCLFPFEKIEAS
ncbi:hypothetical protein JHK86_001210 [Glycine max]|nr:hypothetical protein JHK86_001210 [Glycine max]